MGEGRIIELTAPYKGNNPYVFVSYSHKNSEEVLSTISRMQQLDFCVWYDRGIEPGSEWDENIASHISGCSYFVAFISKEYLESSNCKDELNYARDMDKPFLLIYLSDIQLPGGMSMRLNRVQAIHKYQYMKETDFYQALVDAEEINICRLPGNESYNKTKVSYSLKNHEKTNNDQNNQLNNINSNSVAVENKSGNNKAVGSLVCGIMSLLTSYFGIIIGIVAILLASSARKNGYVGNFAKAGKITGIIGIVISCLVILFGGD